MFRFGDPKGHSRKLTAKKRNALSVAARDYIEQGVRLA
jgi:hypothetical protein